VRLFHLQKIDELLAGKVGDTFELTGLCSLLRFCCRSVPTYLFSNIDANIDDAGAAKLANALMGNERVRTVNLRRNKIADSGATSLATVLVDGTSITEFNLDGMWFLSALVGVDCCSRQQDR
jgi:hypothetical protein